MFETRRKHLFYHYQDISHFSKTHYADIPYFLYIRRLCSWSTLFEVTDLFKGPNTALSEIDDHIIYSGRKTGFDATIHFVGWRFRWALFIIDTPHMYSFCVFKHHRSMLYLLSLLLLSMQMVFFAVSRCVSLSSTSVANLSFWYSTLWTAVYRRWCDVGHVSRFLSTVWRIP